MKRADLEHIIRAAAANSDTDEIVIIGSQAILGSVPEPPAEVCESIEADVFPKKNPEMAILIDGAIGEESVFHRTFGYYAHGVAPETAILPAGAFERLVPIRNENTRGNTGWCLDIHDLAASKLAAGREKDIAFVTAMLRNRLADAGLIRERIGMIADLERSQASLSRLEKILKSI